jgi:hypothetical protein
VVDEDLGLCRLKKRLTSRAAWIITTHRLISLNRLSLIAALLLAIAARASAAPSPPTIGQQAPAFSLLDQNRKRVSLAGAAGTKVVLVFYRGYW